MTAALLRFELAAARKGRTAPLFAAGFALACVTVALAGLSANGALSVQGFARTSISLLQLVLWVVPLLALLTGAAAGAECYELEYVAALPFTRSQIVLTRWAAWLGALGAALCIGLGGAGVVIAVFAGTADAGRYLGLLCFALLLLSACLAVGLAIGVRLRDRGRALAFAVVAWCVLAVGVDLAAIGLLAILPAGTASWPLSFILLLDPIDLARVLGLGLFSADEIAGPTGAALRAVMGGWGASLLLAGLVAWTALPLLFAAGTFRRRDL
ncbi:MAG TPA: ABC transporter permease subunit [Gemmatimonadales bacterium]|nr:ABC transporter permease subunit [Gemmatimonadales bacterium]